MRSTQYTDAIDATAGVDEEQSGKAEFEVGRAGHHQLAYPTSPVQSDKGYRLV
ncbi:hypothetical protein FRB91_004194 [Serendipita sp. 411]|nr:hypothetical protein FRB91_004194 [Serendipita sp. 411]